MADSTNIDPLLGGYTRTTNLTPLQQALQQAQNSRLTANQQALNASVGGYGNQMTAINQGASSAGTYRQPYINTGTSALQQAQQVASGGYNISSDPAFQAIMNQGLRASEQSASAKGGLYSGAHQLELVDLGQQLANKYIQDVYSRNLGLAQMGQSSAENQAAQAYNQGQQIGNVQSNIGNTQANAYLSQGDIQGDTAVNLGKAAVAQSTIAGLGQGQILGAPGGATSYVDGGSTDPWGNAQAAANTAAQNYAAQSSAMLPVSNEIANAGLGGMDQGSSSGGGGGNSTLGSGIYSNGSSTGTSYGLSGAINRDPVTGQPIDNSKPATQDYTTQNQGVTQAGIQSYINGSNTGGSDWAMSQPSATQLTSGLNTGAGFTKAPADTSTPQGAISQAKALLEDPTLEKYKRMNIESLLRGIEATGSDPSSSILFEKLRSYL